MKNFFLDGVYGLALLAIFLVYASAYGAVIWIFYELGKHVVKSLS